ncbi:Zinc finger MYM-type protein 1 [Frankliniella fusca]|uniref:Zinc finger MYM-type protein 1 n=1 Tax=Frankliniella fusca TaxID=407009 RepID=A0AAE1LQR8_9NEOP|nr:Zinc finger MYM-type protein 1 [Frankliniella fusca]
MEPAFVSNGVSKWKDAVNRFKTHEGSQYHKAAVHARLSLKTTPLSEEHARQQAEARVALHAIFSSLKLLARQGLAFRGKTMDESNLMQLLKLRATDIPELDSWLKRRIKYLSPEVQNEMLEIMAHEILRGIIN